jgi:hypothetical protein
VIRMQLHCPLGHACYTKRGKTLDVRIGSKPARETSTLRSKQATVSPSKRPSASEARAGSVDVASGSKAFGEELFAAWQKPEGQITEVATW